MRENLEKAQGRQPKWYDKKHLPAPEYNTLEDVAAGRAKVADKVMLNQHNIKIKRPTEKLDVMNQIEGALTGNCLVRNKVLRMTQLSHEVCISQVTNTC